MKHCNVEYADFVIWRPMELVILRIAKDEVFLNEAMEKATKFFKYGVLPELVGKWYTHVPSPTTQQELHDALQQRCSHDTVRTPDTGRKWCYCNGEESGKMICCENDNCSIQWFHVGCLKIKRIPKKAWYCPDCRKEKKT